MKRVLDAAILITLLAAIAQTASARGSFPTPDAGSTALLMTIACSGLAAVRRFKR